MEQDIDRTMALLERTPGALDELLRGLPAEWTERNEGGNSWNAREVVAHLSHCERTDWMVRVRHLLEFGETQPFPPFDRLGQRRAMEGKAVAELLDEFSRLRADCLEELRALGLGAAELAWKRNTSRAGNGDAGRVAGHVGGARSDPFAPDLTGVGVSVP